MKFNKFAYYYFFLIFSILPISIVIGPSVSLINIILIDLSFIFLLFYIKKFSFINNRAFQLLLVLYLYLIFNSFISIQPELNIYRNFGFVRIILLFVAFNYFFNKKFFFKKVFFIWLIFITFIVLDVFFERFFGQNFIGYGGVYGKRIVSFFRDEPIVGWYILSFYFVIIGYLLDYYKKTSQNKTFILFLIFLIAILLTGERSSSIKAIMGASLFFLFYNKFDLKKKFLILISFLIFLSFLILNSDYLKHRFLNQAFFTTDQSILSNINDSLYLKHYKSGIEVFKNNKLIGVGNKNYRIETCSEKDNLNINQKKNYLCSTHPHQIYFELLSEHGLFGTILLLSIFFHLVFYKVLKYFTKENYIHKGALIYLFLFFIPLIPSGSFFSDYTITIFGLNLSILYGSSKRLNIFNNT